MTAPLSPTQWLLLRLARLQMSDEDRAIARWVAERADLSELGRLAIRGGIAGLCAASLERLRIERLPRAVARELAFAALQTEAANRLLLGETLALCRAAAGRGITLVPFKGMALYLGRPYRDLGSRSSVDVDLVVAREQLLEAERLILSLGYQAKPDRRYFLRHHQHLGFSAERGGRPISVELHWTPFFLLFGTQASDRAALGRLVAHEHEGETLRLFDLEDTLLALLLHLANHRFAGQLKWLVDIAELIRFAGERLDWQALWSRARALGGAGAAAIALRLVDALLGPLAVERGPSGLRSSLQRELASRLLPEAGFWSDRPPSQGRGVLLDILLRDRLGQGLAHLGYKLAELYERRGLEAPRALLRTDLSHLS